MSDFTEADAEAVMTPRYRWVPTTDGYPIPGGGTVVLDSEWLAEHDQAMRDRWREELADLVDDDRVLCRDIEQRIEREGIGATDAVQDLFVAWLRSKRSGGDQ